MDISQNRQTFYHLLLTLLNQIEIDTILFQKILLSFSIVFLVSFVTRKTSLLLGFLSYLLIILNAYYISYSKTILPESILLVFLI